MEPLADLLDRAADVTADAGRPDLLARLDAARRRLRDPHVRVLVVGEFKQGKSQLVNALVNAPVCPVDDDVATSVPTVVAHGETPSATLVLAPPDAPEDPGTPTAPATRVEVPLESLPEHVSELGNPGNARRLAYAEVTLPRRLLADGLVLVDTPGVGGLGSTHAANTMAALPSADAVLLVSDAAQEYSEPELEFLDQAMRLCPNVACVLTKIDLYPHWRQVAELDRGHLAAAGARVRLMPVSSTLRLHAARTKDAELHEESGFGDLVRHLRDDVVGHAGTLARRSTTHDVLAVTDHLLMSARAELGALQDPAGSTAMIEDLVAAREATGELRRRSARWQQTLGDGVADLAADIDYDLRDRLRKITREAEEAIDTADPGMVWEDFDDWLVQRIASAVAANFVWAHERAQWLAKQVGEHFDRQGDVALPELVHGDSQEALDLVARLERVEVERVGPTQKALIALRGSYGGILMFGMVTLVAFGMSIINPFSVGIGVIMGGKAYRDDKKARVKRRQAEAKAAVRRHVDEVVFQVGKDSKDRLRAMQRVLRDHFTTTAEELYRSLDDSVRTAREAASAGEADRSGRVAAARAAVARIEDVRAAALRLGEHRVEPVGVPA
ncbi:dynamin family protein [Cellulomonas sp. ATA003]|uniref:dynamin family protein n=1 Tax=Cellulomonas sp. ATA003 TaxID=3073064 RepID=UPI00287367DF|nr:dynamin family protein [Cellulomonas sp. ATA003]WNB86364.1 dynamin family protein [Cellulomonas sp. ATA003]